MVVLLPAPKGVDTSELNLQAELSNSSLAAKEFGDRFGGDYDVGHQYLDAHERDFLTIQALLPLSFRMLNWTCWDRARPARQH
jgi:hypothetical protein